MTSLGTYAWSESDTTLYSHLFLGQTADFEKAVVKVDSSYPWEGKVTYQVKAKMKDAFDWQSTFRPISAWIHFA